MFLLLAEYGQADVHLDVISMKYFGMSPTVAKRHAARSSLPVLAYRTAPSQKAPWLVRITDLAEYLDAQRDAAVQLRNATQGHESDTGYNKDFLLTVT